MKLRNVLTAVALFSVLCLFGQAAQNEFPAESKIEQVLQSSGFEKSTVMVVSDTVNVQESLEHIEAASKLILDQLKQKIDTPEQFNALVSIILGLVMYLLTRLGKFWPKLLKIEDNTKRAIAVGIATLLGFTLLKRGFDTGVLLQWFVAYGGVTILYQWVLQFLPGFKTPKIPASVG